MIDKYLEYIKLFHISEEVRFWIEHNLVNYLKKNEENQGEIEHIIDYLANKSPKRLKKMSYKQALSNTNKWMKALAKKGKNIEENEGKDFEIVLDFKDGFKIIKLKSKNSYQREGKLMSHCVSSYFGRSDDIYSLRDKYNAPHCTMSKSSKQIKGKGNGKIHPKYIDYVIKFLEFSGVKIKETEMRNLGYVRIPFLNNTFKDFTKLKIKKEPFRNEYFYEEDNIILEGCFTGYEVIIKNINSLEEYNSLPKKAIIFGNVNLECTKNLKKFEQIHPITGNLRLSWSHELIEFKQNYFIGGDLRLCDCKIRKFKQTAPIGGNLILCHTKISEFKQNYFIGGDLSLGDTKIKEFKQTFPIEGSLSLYNTNVKEFKQTHPIGRYLCISRTKIKKFKQAFQIGKNLDIGEGDGLPYDPKIKVIELKKYGK